MPDRQHRRPCKDCPWRRKSAAGWLGSEQTPEQWVQSAHDETYIECHVHEGFQCAGSAIYRKNVCKSPRFPELLVLPADHEAVFSNPSEFIAHHRSHGVVSSEIGKETSHEHKSA